MKSSQVWKCWEVCSPNEDTATCQNMPLLLHYPRKRHVCNWLFPWTSCHDHSHSLGLKALCSGGDQAWPLHTGLMAWIHYHNHPGHCVISIKTLQRPSMLKLWLEAICFGPCGIRWPSDSSPNGHPPASWLESSPPAPLTTEEACLFKSSSLAIQRSVI